MKVTLIIALICLIVGAVLIGAGWVFLNPADMNTIKDSVYEYDIDQVPTQINIFTINSSVELRPIEGNKWKVACMDKENLYHTVELIDGVLTVRQVRTERQWFDFIGIHSGFHNLSVIVYLPQNVYESLSIHSTSGSIKVQEGFVFSNASLQNTSGSIMCNSRVEGDLDVKNTSGSIRIGGGIDGKLEVRNVSGSIEIKDATPESVTIKNISGGIDLINVICAGACDVENGSGSIELERCDAMSFDLKTVSGGIHASILSAKTFDCHSTSGGVKVPENGNGGTFRAKTTSGGIRVTVVE